MSGSTNQSNDQSPELSQDVPASEGRIRRPLPFWKKGLLVVSCVLMVVGLSLQGYSHMRKPAGRNPLERAAAQAPDTAARNSTKRTLPVDKQTPGWSAQSVESTRNAGYSAPLLAGGLDSWSPAVFRLGFSFFVGFCIAHALRTFFRMTAMVIGFILLVLVGLQYAGFVQVDWTALQRQYHSVSGWLATQTASLRDFLTGQLPSAASATLGLFAGFKRH